MSCGYNQQNFSTMQDTWTPKSDLKLGSYYPYPEMLLPGVKSENYSSCSRTMEYPRYPNNIDSYYSGYVKPKEDFCFNRAENLNTYSNLENSGRGNSRDSYETYTRCACAENRFNNYYALENISKEQGPYETYNNCACAQARFNRYNTLESTSNGQGKYQYETYQDPTKPLDTCRKGTYQSLSNNWHQQSMYEL